MAGHSRWDSEQAAMSSVGSALASGARRIARLPRRLTSGVGVAIGRARRGYSWSDVMDFDRYLAEVVGGGTRRLAEQGRTVPLDMTPEEWRRVLLTISDGFALKAQGTPSEQPEVDETRWRTAATLFVQHFDSLAD